MLCPLFQWWSGDLVSVFGTPTSILRRPKRRPSGNLVAVMQDRNNLAEEQRGTATFGLAEWYQMSCRKSSFSMDVEHRTV